MFLSSAVDSSVLFAPVATSGGCWGVVASCSDGRRFVHDLDTTPGDACRLAARLFRDCARHSSDQIAAMGCWVEDSPEWGSPAWRLACEELE